MSTDRVLNQPLSGNEMPRFGGPATFMRLPTATDLTGIDVGIIGVPFDIGTSNRPGARLAPRQIRDESRMLRPYNMATRAAPLSRANCSGVSTLPVPRQTPCWRSYFSSPLRSAVAAMACNSGSCVARIDNQAMIMLVLSQ